MSRRRLAIILAVSAVVGVAATSPAAAWSPATPNLDGAWVPAAGTVRFDFLHRFEVGAPPSYTVSTLPTFQLLAGAWNWFGAGVRYATKTVTVPGASQELEFVVKERLWGEEDEKAGAVALSQAFNVTAMSPDLAIDAGRSWGPLQLLGCARLLGNFRYGGSPRLTVGLGGGLALQPGLRLSGDAAVSPMRTPAEFPLVWGVGLAWVIPASPHTLTLQATNASTGTLQGASVATDVVRYGFLFTVPLAWPVTMPAAETAIATDPSAYDMLARAPVSPLPVTTPGPSTAPTGTRGGDGAVRARSFYAAHCAACHGAAGHGGPFADLRTVEPKGDAVIAKTIRDGVPPTMPAFGGSLAKGELRALVEYVKSL